MYLRPARSQIPVYSLKIWSSACIWDSGSCRYLFSHPKYEAQWHVSESWPVADTCFSTENMKPDIYLTLGRLQILVFLPKIWNRTCIYDRQVASIYFLHISNAWPVANICFSTQNMRPDIYLQSTSRHILKIWLVANTSFSTQNIKPSMYLHPCRGK